MISMEEVYNVTSFLRGELHVDREYPFDFSQEKDKFNNIEPSKKAILSSDESLVHNNSVLFKQLSSDDVVLITLPARKFDRSNRFEIKIKADTEIDLNNVSVSFSESNTGEPSLMTLKSSEKNENISIGKESIIFFEISKQNKIDSKNKKLSNIRSIAISFNQNINELYLIDVVFKNTNYTFTIEDVEKQLSEAEDYVKTKLKKDSVPKELFYLYPKAAAAFISRIRWQSEGKFQDSSSYAHFKRYSQQLLSEIDSTIEAYKEQQEGDEDDINMDLVGCAYM